MENVAQRGPTVERPAIVDWCQDYAVEIGEALQGPAQMPRINVPASDMAVLPGGRHHPVNWVRAGSRASDCVEGDVAGPSDPGARAAFGVTGEDDAGSLSLQIFLPDHHCHIRQSPNHEAASRRLSLVSCRIVASAPARMSVDTERGADRTKARHRHVRAPTGVLQSPCDGLCAPAVHARTVGLFGVKRMERGVLSPASCSCLTDRSVFDHADRRQRCDQPRSDVGENRRVGAGSIVRRCVVTQVGRVLRRHPGCSSPVDEYQWKRERASRGIVMPVPVCMIIVVMSDD